MLTLQKFFEKASTTLPERHLITNKLKNAFFSLKINESTGVGDQKYEMLNVEYRRAPFLDGYFSS